MKKALKTTMILVAVIATLILPCSCGSLEQWADGLQAFGNGLAGTTTYSTSTTNATYIPAATTTTEKTWHDCTSCTGGRCKSCGGTGKNSYAKNGRCGVCLGTGKCAGCDGKGGWYYYR